MAREPEQRTIEANGLRFSAETMGDGPVVLCLHGFPDSNATFRSMLPALADAGYQGVAPLMRGYEPSSQTGGPTADYHMLEVARDVVAWAEWHGTDRVHLVGHDWGAFVTYLATTLAPERFVSAATIAVPAFQRSDALRRLPRQLLNSWYMLFFQLRRVSDAIVARNDFAFLESLWSAWSPGWTWDPEHMEHVKERFRTPGVLAAALAYYRASLNPFSEQTRAVNEALRRPIEVPTLAITGSADGCLDTRMYDLSFDEALFPAGLEISRVDGAGHFAHAEAPEDVNRLVIDWVGRHR